ncbi:MAG: cation transporter [Actinobacteria bacterium]|nr:cation transporter [Actinomycetota bacterium]
MNSIRNVVRVVAIANLTYFAVEFFFALKIGSVSLFSDSIDFLEDASVNILIFIGLGWTLLARKRLSRFLSALLMIPAISVVITAVYKINNPSAPSGEAISFVALGALIVNFTCAFLLVKFRQNQQSLVLAAYLSARNDALANIAVITAGVITILWISPIPDLIVGISIGILNADAAVKVWRSTEH